MKFNEDKEILSMHTCTVKKRCFLASCVNVFPIFIRCDIWLEPLDFTFGAPPPPSPPPPPLLPPCSSMLFRATSLLIASYLLLRAFPCYFSSHSLSYGGPGVSLASYGAQKQIRNSHPSLSRWQLLGAAGGLPTWHRACAGLLHCCRAGFRVCKRKLQRRTYRQSIRNL